MLQVICDNKQLFKNIAQRGSKIRFNDSAHQNWILIDSGEQSVCY